MPNHPGLMTIPRLFRESGYQVVGAGKIFHHTAGNNPPNQWDDFFRLTFRNDPWFRANRLNYPWSNTAALPEAFPFSEVRGLGHENDWGVLDIQPAGYDDSLTADYAIQFLQNAKLAESGNPFFLACGIFRPHLPWYVPRKFFDQYPLEDIVLPRVLDSDLDDVPKAGKILASDRRKDLNKIHDSGRYPQAIRAYLASVTFADFQIGRVLRALEQSEFVDNTIVVLWSDHGWHLGEKQHWHKSTLWEEATRVPLIFRDPTGTTGQTCESAVSLVDIFPTLIDLCSLSDYSEKAMTLPLDGTSLKPLLDQPTRAWNKPALIEFRKGNAAVRSNRYRYIRYADGTEELYDHETDKLEWYNLAADPTLQAVKSRLSRHLPKRWAEPAETKKAFDFNYREYTWTHKKNGTVVVGQ